MGGFEDIEAGGQGPLAGWPCRTHWSYGRLMAWWPEEGGEGTLRRSRRALGQRPGPGASAEAYSRGLQWGSRGVLGRGGALRPGPLVR